MLKHRFFLLVASGLYSMLALSACGDASSKPFVVLFCLDGASPDVIRELRSQGRLPHFEGLIRSGTYGRLQSYPARKIMADSLRRGYWSPVVWSTIATGKVPEKHGIRDFVLPIQGTSSVWMGTEENPGQAELTLPELSGEAPYRLSVRLHSYAPNGAQKIRLLWNGEPLETLRAPTKWETLSVGLPLELLRPAENRLAFVFSRQSRPSDNGKSKDRRRLACEMAFLRITDSRGREVVAFDPVMHRYSLGRGFYKPRGHLTEVQSVHLKAQPVWKLLELFGHPVGVIGYWASWPAYPVKGFLVSSRMGIAEKRYSSRLTWPPELAGELKPLAPTRAELEEQFKALHVSECNPPLIDTKSVLKKILMQDELYFRISRKLLPSMEHGFFTVYFRAIDVGSHVALHWRNGAEIPEGCPESIRDIVDQIYIQIDRYIGEILSLVPKGATVLAVSDHGMTPLDTAGYHAPYGIFMASGAGIRTGTTIQGATVLDIAPTILYLFGAPVPLDMDGKILPYVFESSWLVHHPPRYADIDTSRATDEKASTEGTEEILKDLRALGYIR